MSIGYGPDEVTIVTFLQRMVRKQQYAVASSGNYTLYDDVVEVHVWQQTFSEVSEQFNTLYCALNSMTERLYSTQFKD